MMSSRPPVIDLSKLKSEILDGPPEAALPCNLSDYWLKEVATSLEQLLEIEGEDSEAYMTGPMALVLHIHFGKQRSDAIQISQDQLFQNLVDYRTEIALEEVNRYGNVKCKPATLETIFTDRLVEPELQGE